MITGSLPSAPPPSILGEEDAADFDPGPATAEAAGAPVQSRCFGTLYHEIFNEPEPSDPGDSPFRALATWLDARG